MELSLVFNLLNYQHKMLTCATWFCCQCLKLKYRGSSTYVGVQFQGATRENTNSQGVEAYM